MNHLTRQIGSTEYDLTFDGENHLVHVQANQPFPTEIYSWEPLTTPSPTPVITETPTPTATATETLTPTATAAPVYAQVIGQCGPFTSTSATVTIPAETTLLVVVEGDSNHTYPTSYTVGGQALTLQVTGGGTTTKTRIYYRNLPPTGSQTITLTGQLTMVSANSLGTPGNGESGIISLQQEGFLSNVRISGDGRFVAFSSQAANLLPAGVEKRKCFDPIIIGSYPCYDLFVYDRQSEELNWVSQPK